MKTKNYLFAMALVLFTFTAFAQQKIKDGTVAGSSNLPNPSAILELESSSKGLLLPRVGLFATHAIRPFTGNVAGMVVYNINTINDVTPGIYYNDGTQWVKQAGTSDGWSLTGNAGTNGGNFLGTTDNSPLRFKVNNVNAGFIDTLYGSNNTAFGYTSLVSNPGGANNTALGSNTLTLSSSGSANTAAGAIALVAATGNANTALGFKAGSALTSGNHNLAIGWGADVPVATGDDQLSIANTIYGTGITGAVGAGNIGIGVTAPVSKLQVNASGGVGQIIHENGTTLSYGGKIGSSPVLSSLVVKNPDTYYQQAYINETVGTIAVYQTVSNLLAFDHYSTPGSTAYSNSNFLLPYGGVAFGHFPDITGYSSPQLGIWYLRDNVMALGKINGKTNTRATNTAELVTDVAAHKVGIGTTTPTEKLEINGAIKINSTYTGISNGATSPVPTGGAGTMIFQASDSHFYGWNGLVWKQLDN